jgi:signal recognition particle receptor subunit beta
MKDSIANKKTKTMMFQVLLLDNNANNDVAVQEAGQVNFFQVKEHLKNGGSVFITSKDSQKLLHPKAKAQLNYSKSRRNYGALFHQHLRSS